jgi:hypothetical protein
LWSRDNCSQLSSPLSCLRSPVLTKYSLDCGQLLCSGRSMIYQKPALQLSTAPRKPSFLDEVRQLFNFLRGTVVPPPLMDIYFHPPGSGRRAGILPDTGQFPRRPSDPPVSPVAFIVLDQIPESGLNRPKQRYMSTCSSDSVGLYSSQPGHYILDAIITFI